MLGQPNFMEESKNLENVISLLELPMGEEAIVDHFKFDKEKDSGSGRGFRARRGRRQWEEVENRYFLRRMIDLGIKEGAKIIRRTNELPCQGGPIAVQIGQSSYCLGYWEARKIYVRYENEIN